MESLQNRSLDIRFYRIIRIITCGLKVIGLAPFCIQQTTKPKPTNSRKSSSTSAFIVSKVGLAYNVSLSIAVLIIGAAATPELFTMSYPNKSHITQIIDVELAIVRTLTSSVVIFSWAFRQVRATSIMNRLLEVDHLLSGMKKDLTSERRSFTFFAVQTTLNTSFWLIFWASESAYIHSFLNWFIFNAPIFIIYWFVMEYAMVLGVAATELESFNKNLITLKELPNHSSLTPPTAHNNIPVTNVLATPHGQLASLELLHSIRTTLYEVCQDISDFFSMLILPAVACLTMTITYNIYYLCIPLVITIGTPPTCTVINVVVWILVSFFSLVSLSYNVTRTLKQAKQTGIVVHKLLATPRRHQIHTELQRFSLQLIHEDLSFTACGFFSLDFTLIQSIFGTTTTYLVIIIQFMK